MNYEEYEDDFDIVHLHSRIAAILIKDKDLVPYIEQDIEVQTDPEKKKSLIEQRDILKTLGRWKRFYSEVRSILYQFIEDNEQDSDLRDDTQSITTQGIATHQRLSRIRRYIEIANRYVPNLNIIWVPKKILLCPTCSKEGIKEINVTVSGRIVEQIICPVCKNEIKKDKDDFKKSKRSPTGSVANFMRCIASIECTSSIQLPSKLVSDLDEFALSVKMYTSEEIRSMPKNEYGERGPYSLSDLKDLLKHTGYSNFYNEIWKIACIYWGWEAYSFTLEEKKNFEELCSKIQTLDSDIEGDINGSINREWLAAHILVCFKSNFKGKKFNIANFNSIKTPEIQEEYELKWAYYTKNLGLPPTQYYSW